MELTQEEFAAATACGCSFVPVTEAQVALLAMQRRIFTFDGKQFVVTRDASGFYETHATLALLIGAHSKGEERWLGKFGQADKWISCLTAAKVPRIRSKNDETSAADT